MQEENENKGERGNDIHASFKWYFVQLNLLLKKNKKSYSFILLNTVIYLLAPQPTLMPIIKNIRENYLKFICQF